MPLCAFCAFCGSFSFVGLAKTVPRIGDGERSVWLRGHLDPIGGSVVRRRGKGAGPGLWRLEWSDRHGGLRLIYQIRDEHSGHGVLLSAELRKMNLPEIFEPRHEIGRAHV